MYSLGTGSYITHFGKNVASLLFWLLPINVTMHYSTYKLMPDIDIASLVPKFAGTSGSMHCLVRLTQLDIVGFE